MLSLNNGPIPASLILEGEHDGPTIAIVGGTHANEKVGIEVVKNLANSVQALAGKVLLMLGNPAGIDFNQAHNCNDRFLDEDLNRILNSIGLDKAANAKNPNTEQVRALEIADVLSKLKPDLLIDLHNTIHPSDPFIYCENTRKHFQYLRYLSLASAVYSPDPDYNGAVDSAIDSFVDRLGGVGITYETGCLQDGSPEEVVKTVTQEMMNVLAQVGCIDSKNYQPLNRTPKEHFEIFENIKAQEELHFLATVSTGVSFSKDEPIAIDGDDLIHAPEKCVMLFPKGQIIQPGRFACELARPFEVPKIFSGRGCPGIPFYDEDLLS